MAGLLSSMWSSPHPQIDPLQTSKQPSQQVSPSFNQVVHEKTIAEDLRSELKELGLSTNGDKIALMTRLQMAYLGWYSPADEAKLRKHFAQTSDVLKFECGVRGASQEGQVRVLRRNIVVAEMRKGMLGTMPTQVPNQAAVNVTPQDQSPFTSIPAENGPPGAHPVGRPVTAQDYSYILANANQANIQARDNKAVDDEIDEIAKRIGELSLRLSTLMFIGRRR